MTAFGKGGSIFILILSNLIKFSDSNQRPPSLGWLNYAKLLFGFNFPKGFTNYNSVVFHTGKEILLVTAQ